MDEFKLGKYTFSTEEEYNNAKKEAILLKTIKDKYDLNNPKVLEAIINKIKPSTPVGVDFINSQKISRQHFKITAF